jgi:hypothetical protein
VIDADTLPGGGGLRLAADTLKQRVVCFRDRSTT